MHPLVRRLSDGAVGALAVAIVLGGAAAAVTTDGFGVARSSDDPPSQLDDRDGRVVASTTSSSSASTSASIPTSTTLPTGSTVTLPVPTDPVTTAAPNLAAAGAVVHPVLDAGSVTVVREGAVLRVVEVRPNAGWTTNVERGLDREVEVTFRSGGARVDFNAELEDGAVRIRVRDRRTESGGSATTVPSVTVPRVTTPGVPVPPIAAPEVRTYSAAGGSVTVALHGGTLSLSLASPNAGYAAEVHESRSDRIEVRFDSGDRESRIEVRVEGGRLVPRIDED
jgi:hypothetical protein